VGRGCTLPTKLTPDVWGLGGRLPTVDIALQVVPAKF